MSLALVPVQPLGAGKSRLRERLAPEAVDALVLAMLEDVLAGLGDAPELDRRVVVTPDPRVAETARVAGAEAFLDDSPGLNAALDAARAALAPGDEPLLVVLGDVPGVGPDEVRALFRALAGLGGRGVVLAPSRDGGTSALLRAPGTLVPHRFGKHSALAHREQARSQGVPCCELPLPALELDVDRPEDLAALRERPGASRTRALLERLGADATP